MKKIIFLLLLSSTAFAESLQSFGAMSFINITKNLSPRYDLTLYHYDIFAFADQKFQGREYRSGPTQTYFQTALTYRYLPQVNFSLGYIYSRNNPFLDDSFQNESRLFQQVVFSQLFTHYKLSHRFRFEERMIDNRSKKRTDLRTRLRYQIGAKTTLRPANNGVGELYLNSYNEFYFSTSGERNAFYSDNWTYAGLGYTTQELGSFELGPLLQYSVVNRDKDQRFFYVIQAGWLIKF